MPYSSTACIGSRPRRDTHIFLQNEGTSAGPKDLQKGQFVMVRRDTGDKMTSELLNGVNAVQQQLENMHDSMFAK